MTESTTSSPADAVFKTFMFTAPETAQGFSRNTFTRTTAQALQPANLTPWNPLVLLKSLRAYYSGCFVVRGNQRR